MFVSNIKHLIEREISRMIFNNMSTMINFSLISTMIRETTKMKEKIFFSMSSGNQRVLEGQMIERENWKSNGTYARGPIDSKLSKLLISIQTFFL